MRRLLSPAAVLRHLARPWPGARRRLGAGLVVLLPLLLSGPQGALLMHALAGCGSEPAAAVAKCMSRECCCGARGNGAAACRVGPARCDPAAPFVLTAAKGVLPPSDAALHDGDGADPIATPAAVRTADGHGRELDRPPRASR